MRRLTGLLVAGLALAGCGAENDGGLDVEQTASPIINGSTDLSAYPNEQLRTVFLSNKGVGGCTATVLRPRVVLTARHCINSNGLLVGNLQTPSKITVNGVAAVDFHVSWSYVDAALVFFGSDVVFQWEDFTAIDPYTSSRHVGTPEIFTGFGIDQNGVGGKLRVGTVTPYAIDTWYNPTSGGSAQGTFASNASTGTASGSGDSGSPRWGESTIYPRPVAGVTSAGYGVAFGASIFAQAADFRYEFRSSIFEHYDPSVAVGFDSLADLQTNFQPLQAVSGTAPNWQVTGSALVQVANAPQSFQIQTGSFENYTASMYVQATDDDTVGIAFRYVDRNNHFRCEVSGSAIQIVRRLDGFDKVLVSTTRSGAMNAVLTANSTENRHTCNFGGRWVAVTSSNFAIGKLGIYNHFNKGAKILWWGSQQEVPVDRTW